MILPHFFNSKNLDIIRGYGVALKAKIIENSKWIVLFLFIDCDKKNTFDKRVFWHLNLHKWIVNLRNGMCFVPQKTDTSKNLLFVTCLYYFKLNMMCIIESKHFKEITFSDMFVLFQTECGLYHRKKTFQRVFFLLNVCITYFKQNVLCTVECKYLKEFAFVTYLFYFKQIHI